MEATIDTTTPVETPATTPAAPATTETAAPPPTSQRPTSFAEAFEQVAAKQEQDPAANQETAATAPPADTVPVGEKKGPIPFDVHEKSMANARTKERDAVMTEVQPRIQQLESHVATLMGLPPQEIAEVVKFSRDFSTNPRGFTFTALKTLLADPVHAAQTRSEIARMFSGLRQPSTVADVPDVQITDEAGKAIGSLRDIVQSFVGPILTPLQQDLQARKDAETKAKVEATRAEHRKAEEAKRDAALADVDALLEIGKDTPEPEQVALYQAISAHLDKGLTPHQAAMAVRKSHVMPKLEGKAHTTAVNDLRRKAAGNTATGTAATATPKRPTTREELRQFMESFAQ